MSKVLFGTYVRGTYFWSSHYQDIYQNPQINVFKKTKDQFNR